jgi:hypothetical protein
MSFTRGSRDPEGYPVSDSGPVLGPGWWYLIVILFLAAGLFGFWIISPGLTASSEDPAGRRIAMALLTIGVLPLLITIVQAVRLFRRLGRAKLYVPHSVLPLGFSGTVTYLRPLRGGATIEGIEVRLQCEEVLEKGRGKNKRTYRKVVYDEPITPVTMPMMDLMRVQIPVRIPESGPPSLDQLYAQINWWVRLRLRMRGCPNTRSSFEVEVYPAVVKR